MLTPICYTCGNLLSNIQLAYQRDIKLLCEKHNVKLETMSRGIVYDEKFNKEKENIVNKYTEPHRYCCKMRLTNFSDIVHIVG